MEPEGSLLQSQVPDNRPYPQPARSSPYLTFHFLKIHLNIILPSTPGSPNWSLSHRFLHQNPVYASPLLCPIRATCPTHLILLDFTSCTSRWYVVHAFHVRVGVLVSYYMHAREFTYFFHVFYFSLMYFKCQLVFGPYAYLSTETLYTAASRFLCIQVRFMCFSTSRLVEVRFLLVGSAFCSRVMRFFCFYLVWCMVWVSRVFLVTIWLICWLLGSVSNTTPHAQ